MVIGIWTDPNAKRTLGYENINYGCPGKKSGLFFLTHISNMRLNIGFIENLSTDDTFVWGRPNVVFFDSFCGARWGRPLHFIFRVIAGTIGKIGATR